MVLPVGMATTNESIYPVLPFRERGSWDGRVSPRLAAASPGSEQAETLIAEGEVK